MIRTVEEVDVELNCLRHIVVLIRDVHGFRLQNIVWDRIDRLLDERDMIVKGKMCDLHVL